jgi:uncharacterized membrane protein
VAAAARAAAAREVRGETRGEDGGPTESDRMIGFSRRIRRLMDVPRIERAIADAELRTSGEIRVSVAPLFWGSVDRAAERAFVRLGVGRTREKNGVLLFVVPARRRFVVLGGAGIHERVGDAFWDELVRTMTPYFRQKNFTDGIVKGIEAAAEALAAHFPRASDDVNELPDDVDLGE